MFFSRMWETHRICDTMKYTRAVAMTTVMPMAVPVSKWNLIHPATARLAKKMGTPIYDDVDNQHKSTQENEYDDRYQNS